MTTRDRTSLFLQYRNSFGKGIGSLKVNSSTYMQVPSGIGGGGSGGGIGNSSFANGEDGERLLPLHKHKSKAFNHSIAIDMGTLPDNAQNLGSFLPPLWMDTIDGIQEDIQRLKEKILQVESMQKKNVLPGFDDEVDKTMNQMETLSHSITNEFYVLQKRIKKVSDIPRSTKDESHEEQIMARNASTRLAVELQDLSSRFKQSQSTYLSKLRGLSTKGNNLLFQPSALDTAMPNRFDMGFTEMQLSTIQNNEHLIDKRSKEVDEIAKNIGQIAEIFRDLQTMVIDQGTLFDRIDYNIENMSTNVKSAHTELQQGEKLQKSSRKKTLLIFLALLVIILFIAVLAKRSVSTKS